MPSPGAGSASSLSYMAAFLRSKSNNPSQGFTAGAGQRDVTRYQETQFAPVVLSAGFRIVPAVRGAPLEPRQSTHNGRSAFAAGTTLPVP